MVGCLGISFLGGGFLLGEALACAEKGESSVK